MKLSDLKKDIKTRLENAGISDAESETRIILTEYANVTLSDMFADPDKDITGADVLSRIEDVITRRCTGIPLQHITGRTGFMGFDFKVTPAALVPRPDTEILAEEALKDYHDGSRILDLCTGSGCIIISLLALMNDCDGVGTDISEDALKLASENADLILGEKRDRLKLLKGDLYDALQADDMFEVIVSNPPYIRTSEIETLSTEVKDHDPYIALDGGEDGLDFYRKIISGARAHLRNGGELLLEIGFDQASDVTDIMKDNGFIEVQTIKDFGGNDRVVRGVLSAL
ncbi:MAG: peptide chain release factor N(5)-glutamine methyltransferase [Lachnospiraceae bacterium]|nr:peptide chain release factor N(5)-glutamine methyltransferase [Lachnospiraceae bacterium]